MPSAVLKHCLPKCLNKDTMFMDICKEKINFFPEGTLFANACTSARIGQRCCYLMPATFFEKRTNRTQCLLLRTNMSDRNRMPPISNLENCQSVRKVYKLFCKIRIAGLICAFCKWAWKLRGANKRRTTYYFCVR